jgi:hypothetical protein
MASSVAVRGAPAIRPLRITALSEQSGGAGLPVRDRLGFGTNRGFSWHSPGRARLVQATTGGRRLPDPIGLTMPPPGG